MADGNRTSVHIYTSRIESKFIDARDRLGGKGFIQLDQFQIARFPLSAGKRLSRRWDWPEPHAARIDAGRRRFADACDCLETELPGHFHLDDQQSSRPVI